MSETNIRFSIPGTHNGPIDGGTATAEWKRLMHLETGSHEARRGFAIASLASIALIIVLWSTGLPAELLPAAILFVLLLPLIVLEILRRRPERRYALEEGRMLIDSPIIMGLLTISLLTDRSLEKAVSFIVSNTDGPLSNRLRMMGWHSIAGRQINTPSAIDVVLGTISSANRPVARSLAMAMGSVHEVDPGMSRTVLDRANGLLLEGLKERMDRFLSSLQTPFMVIFSLNIMVPMILVTMMPLLDYGGSDGSFRIVVLVLCMIMPVGLLFARSIVNKNPFRTGGYVSSRVRVGAFVAITSSLTVLFFIWMLHLELTPAVMTLLSPLAAIPSRILRGGERSKSFDSLTWADSMDRIGNRLMSGFPLIESLAREKTEAIRIQAMSLKIANGIEGHRLHAGTELGPLALEAVTRLAEKDSRAAGMAAIHLGQYLSDMGGFKQRLETGLSGISDMMRSTMLFIAPIVFAMTLSMASLMGVDGNPLETTMTIYLVFLVLMVSYLSTFIKDEGWDDMLFRVVISLPASLAIFIIALKVCQYCIPAV